MGINCAPWNVEKDKISYKKNKFFVGKNDLVFFHFQGLRRIIYSFYYTNFSAYKVVPIPELKRLYSMYINKVDRKRRILAQFNHKFNFKIAVKATFLQ